MDRCVPPWQGSAPEKKKASECVLGCVMLSVSSLPSEKILLLFICTANGNGFRGFLENGLVHTPCFTGVLLNR